MLATDQLGGEYVGGATVVTGAALDVGGARVELVVEVVVGGGGGGGG